VGTYRLGYCLAGQSDLRPFSERQAESHHNQLPFFLNVENELDARSPEGFILKGNSMQDTMNKPAGLQSIEPTALSLEHEGETREPVRNMGSEPSSSYEAGQVTRISLQTYLALNERRSDLTDDDLVQQARSGDQGAFEILFERYSTSLLFLIYRIMRDEHLAHDILQHVFIQLYRSLPTLVRGGTLSPWLIQVARRRCIDELRRRRPILFSEIESCPDGDDYSYLTMLPDPGRQPEEQAELHELRLCLLDAIERLPLRYRAVVLLRYKTQQSYREIGLALRIPETTAKTYFHRASKRLRTLLASEFANYSGQEKL
jgi:RNA polymerase sigma factor (sigma-70 family)